MNLIDFEKLVKTEAAARRFLLARCEAAGGFRCPRCSFTKLYEIEMGKRRRCARCGHSFNPFADRYLNRVKLSAVEWLWIVKLFELEAPATVAAAETGISYPTVFKAFGTIRRAIAEGRWHDSMASASCGPSEIRTVAGAPRAICAPEAGGIPPGDFVILSIPFGDGCIVLSKKPADFAHIICCGRRLDIVDHGKRFPRYCVYCSEKGFWPFAKERLVKHHGVTLEKLPSYLEEMIFRWTNRGTPIFDLLLDRLCLYAPEEDLPQRRGEEELLVKPAG